MLLPGILVGAVYMSRGRKTKEHTQAAWICIERQLCISNKRDMAHAHHKQLQP